MSFPATLKNLSLDNLSESIDKVSSLRITVDLWSQFLNIFEPYKTQDVYAQFFILLIDNIYSRLPDNELVKFISEYRSNDDVRFNEMFERSFNGKPRDPYKEFTNQLLRENIFVTSNKNVVPLIAVFCAVSDLKVTNYMTKTIETK